MSRVDDINDWRDKLAVAETALTRLRLEAGRTILRATDEQTLFEPVCRLLIEVGGFRLAWVGLTEPTGDRLSEAAVEARDAAAGDCVRELARSEEGRRGLTRRMRYREPWVITVPAGREAACPDNPWAGLAGRSNGCAVAYLPIASDRIVHGVLVIAADDTEYFDPLRLRQLEHLAGDLAVKLDWLGRWAIGLAGREALEQAAARLHAFFDLSPHAILLVSAGAIETNATFAMMFGIEGSREASSAASSADSSLPICGRRWSRCIGGDRQVGRLQNDMKRSACARTARPSRSWYR